MKNKLLILLLLSTSLITYANLPPTSSKADGESVFSTTFNTDYDTIPVTRSGATITIGTIPVSKGGTGSSTQNFVDLTTNQTVGGTKTFSSAVVSDDYEFSDANFNTISSKESLAVVGSTGVMNGGIVSIGTPNTTVTISDGSGYCSSNTGTNSLEKISWTGLTNQALTFLNTNLVTYLAIDCSTGLLNQQVTPYTNIQSRDYILLGAAIHSDLTTVNAVNQLQQVTISPLNQLGDLQRSLGFFNIYGNIYSANGANLNINKTIGDVHKQGANWSSNSKNPNVVTLSPGTALTFRYRTQTGAEGSDVTAVDPAQYDLAGVLTSVPVSRFTVQRINVFSSGLTRIQYGQALYNSEADAIAAIQVDPFITETNISENGLLRGFLIVKGNATDLSDPDQAMFLEAPKFGGTGGVGGLSTTTLQGAYNNSTTPQIITSTALGSVDIRRGSATDTDNVIRIQNGAGSDTATINGNGLLTLSTALPISSGGTGSATQNFVDLTTNQTIAGVKTLSDGIVANVTGNATTVTTNANLTGDVTSVGNATTYNAVVPINKGGTGASTKAAAFDALSPMTTGGDIIYGGASGTGTRLANGSSGQVLTSNGGTSAPTWSAAPVVNSFNTANNVSFAASVGSSALTIALKDSSGADPSGASTIGFRSATLTSGAYVTRTIPSALSIVVSSGSTLGHVSGVAKNIWLYAIDNAGTVELAVSSNQFDESYLYSTTAEGGVGAADSVSVLYSTTARTNVAIRLIGRLLSTQTTAGTWAAVPTDVSMTYEKELTVSALYTGAPVTGSIGAAYNTITYGTRLSDSHSAYSGGVYTIPVSGVYDISAAVDMLATYALGNNANIAIAIDGTTTYIQRVIAAGAVGSLMPEINIKSLPLLAGQTVRIQAFNSGTTPSYSSLLAWFSITRTGNY